MAINYKNEIVNLLETSNLFYSLFNVPTRLPHVVCICDDNSMAGNCWGKVVIGGKTWHEVYDILTALNLTPHMVAGRKLHEVPDNHDGKLVRLTNIQYDIDEDLGNGPDNIIALIPSRIKTEAEAGDFLSDYISDKTGWCHNGFDVVPSLTSIYRK